MVFIYRQHQGFDIYLSATEIPEEKLYCAYCGERDELLMITSDVTELDALMEEYDAWSASKEELRRSFLEMTAISERITKTLNKAEEWGRNNETF